MDPFAVLGLERRFDVDLRAAEKTHRELSRALHPDRYASAGASEKREALSRAVAVNEAWRVVRDPVQRAEALFRLAGVPVGETNEPKPSPAFLMEMMEQRETLEAAKASRDLARVRQLAAEIEGRVGAVESALTAALRDGGAAGVEKLGELRFYRRFLEEVSAIEDEAAQ